MSAVEVRQLTKRFDGADVDAVDHLDLVTEEGEYLVLLGPSGCGKTTLLRLIAGLEQPTSGEVLIGGEAVAGLPPRARRIAMVFQSYALYPHKTARRNIEFPLKAQRVESAQRAEKVEWAATLLGITNLLDRRPRQLSGGERQRVALARALVRDPTVFLLDEPLSNLDAKLRATARDDLKEFQKRVGTTTIYVTHDQVEAMGMGDRIAVMSAGRLRQLGTPLEVYHEPADTFVATFLGSPPMNIVEHEDVLVGFRPESLLPKGTVTPDDGALTLSFRVQRIEYLGAERHLIGTVHWRGAGARVRSLLPATVSVDVAVDEDHEFVIRAADLRFFDRQSTLRTERRRI